jgi:predicted nucleic acid-binding protein
MARLRREIDGAIVLDAQGLVKLATGDPAVRGRVRAAQERGSDVVTAASTVAEVLRGGPKDAPVHQALKQVRVTPITNDLGRKAGELLGATGMSGHSDTLDSLLAAVALAQPRPVVLLTSDPGDMAKLTEEPHRKKADRIAVIQV